MIVEITQNMSHHRVVKKEGATTSTMAWSATTIGPAGGGISWAEVGQTEPEVERAGSGSFRGNAP